ncbi:hypothetical protein CERSUDRAFT_115072 [Gelatoporia subvermispora B]|uniref:GP-PDE domain-containing protein n=1 Tax=Ceriporiopsis subvermispora (strain B) TaxID=914234 RepID=M2RFC2_CERS8|nr:hypothetical protein CERSUDRAFT_115072 [Gelatoporia subvermispora B]
MLFSRRPGPLSCLRLLAAFYSTNSTSTFSTYAHKAIMAPPKQLPECWGHRGASAAYPENTLASFEAAIRDGAEGIESDVHMSLDDVVIMFHDPSLDRTTNGTGFIREKLWYGPEGMEQLRTTKEPRQSIPTFAETVALLMKPENLHVKLNVDVKVQSDPKRLFPLMHKIISAHPDWETNLAPRILLGLWHPKFLPYAKKHLPYCRRSFIGASIEIARSYFWNHCDVFSIFFAVLTTAQGEKFRADCKAAGKKVMVWTVNDPVHLVEVASWGDVDVVITDVPNVWLQVRSTLQADYDKIIQQHSRRFLWTSPWFYSAVQSFFIRNRMAYLESVAGPFREYDDADDTLPPPQSVSASA